MAIMPMRCPISQNAVTLVVDLEGHASRVICPEFQEQTRVCRLKKDALAGGRLSQLLARLSENTLGQRTVECSLC